MRRLRSAGFTLVEALLALALTSVMLFILTDMMVTLVTVQTESESASSITQDGRYLLNKFRYDIQAADSISTPGSLGSTTTSLVAVIGGESYTYQINANNNLVRNPASPPGNIDENRLNGSGTSVSNITFQRLGSSGGTATIKLSFTLVSTTAEPGVTSEQTFNTTIGMRP